MKRRWLKKYLVIVFIISTFIGVFHHHNDLKQHNECQICTVQSSIANADMPTETVYLSEIKIYSEEVESNFPTFSKNRNRILLKARAPPFFS